MSKISNEHMHLTLIDAEKDFLGYMRANSMGRKWQCENSWKVCSGPGVPHHPV